MHSLLYLLAFAACQATVEASGIPSNSHHQLLRRGHDPKKDVYLGTLKSLDDFYLRLGTNVSDWETIEHESESEDLILESESMSTAVTPRNQVPDGLQIKNGDFQVMNDECLERSGLDYLICEAMPFRWYLFGAGVFVTIQWAPSVIDNWFEDIARFMANGAFSYTTRYQRLRNGQEGPANKLKVRNLDIDGLDLSTLDLSLLENDGAKPEIIHFNIEEHLENFSKRDVSAELDNGVFHEARAWERWTLDTRTGVLQSKGSDSVMKVDGSERAKRSASANANANGTSGDLSDYGEELRWGSGRPSSFATAAAERYETYSIVITSQRFGNYFPFSSTSCIKKYFYERVWDAETVGRWSCMPMAEEATRASNYQMVGVMINPGDDFSLKWGDCCD